MAGAPATYFCGYGGYDLTLLLREDDVRELLPMQAAVDLVHEAFQLQGSGGVQNQPRRRIHYSGGLFHYMAAAIPEKRAVGLKAYDSTRSGTRFLVVLFDSQTSALLALVEADWLGRIRTGAASGVASAVLARSDARVAGIIGAGGQAETQIEALAVATQLDLVKVYSRTPRSRESLATRMSERLSMSVEAVGSAQDAVAGSDIVTTITSSSEPVLEGQWLEPGMHINAAGSNGATRRELDRDAVERATRILTDSVEGATLESGDLLQVPEFDWNQVADLGDVIAGKAPGRSSDSDITLFESQGVALEDIAVARFIYDRAVEQGRGEQVGFGEPG